MKIVVCSNCGAKYKLEDSDDVNSFECSVCTGNLEELNKDNQVSNKVDDFELDSDLKSTSVIVCCQNCGLKFKLDKSENIFDFECVSCEGPLKYLDDELNKMYDLKVIDNNDTDDFIHEVEIIDDGSSLEDHIASLNNNSDDAIIVKHNSEEEKTEDIENSKDELNKINNEVSDEVNNVIENPQINQEDNLSNFNKDSLTKTTTVDKVDVNNSSEDNSNNSYEDNSNDSFEDSSDDLSDVSNNFTNDSVYDNQEIINSKVESIDSVEDVSVSNDESIISEEESDEIVNEGLVFDNVQEQERYELTLLRTYNALKDSIKKEYLTELDDELLINRISAVNDKNMGSNKGAHHGTGMEEYSNMSYKDLLKSRKDRSAQYNYIIPIILGILCVIVGIAVYILLNLLIIMGILIAIGIIIFVYGVYKKIDYDNVEVRTKIIREKLEGLPDDFYIFYYTKPPYAKAPLNHVIVGPTGVFTILSQKYSAKQDKNRQKSDDENNALVGGASDIGNYINNRNTLELTDGYDDNQTRFQFGNEEIKFDYNNKIKHKSLTLNEDLAIFLDKCGITGVYIEPLIGFINEDVAVINVVLTNEDLFLEELLYKIVKGPKRLDPFEVMRISKLLSRYSINCNIQN